MGKKWFLSSNAIAIFGFVFFLTTDWAWANRITLIYTGHGVGPKIGKNTVQAIRQSNAHSEIKVFTDPSDLADFLDMNVQNAKKYTLVMPGGNAAQMIKALAEVSLLGTFEPGTEAIKHFVRQGGNYLGICAGSNLATDRIYLADSPDFINPAWKMTGLMKANAYWPSHPSQVGEEAKGQWVELETPDKKKFKSFWHTGSYLAEDLVKSKDSHGVSHPDIEVLARYTHATQKNAIGAMSSKYGEGKVITSAFHPEVTKEFAQEQFGAVGSDDSDSKYTHTDFWKELLVRSEIIDSIDSIEKEVEQHCATQASGTSFPVITNLNKKVEEITKALH